MIFGLGNKRRGVLRAAAALCVAALAITGCAKGSVSHSKEKSETHGIQLPPEGNFKSFASQQPKWRSCGETGAECADIYAPQSWENLGGPTISLHVAKLPATKKKQGTIFINFGGPGGAGAERLAELGKSEIFAQLREHFELVSWDPRGTGSSSTVNCLSDAQLDQVVYGTGGINAAFTTASEEWFQSAKKYAASFSKGCEAGSGALLGNVDTQSTVQDLEMLRAMFASPKLNYLGYSYGTLLGQEYAKKHPDKVGRFVLDGVLGADVDLNEITIGQAAGYQVALEAFLDWCSSQEECPFTGTREDALQQISDELTKLVTDPVPTESGRYITRRAFTNALTDTLTHQAGWEELRSALQAYFAGEPEKLLALADSYYQRGEKRYEGNLLEAYFVIMCDDTGKVDGELAEARTMAEQAEAKSQVFGRPMADDAMVCSRWPVKAKRDFKPVDISSIANPILLIGSTGDPSTPYEWAENIAKNMPGSALLTYQGFTHVASTVSPCVRDAVARYFAAGEVPQPGAVCAD